MILNKLSYAFLKGTKDLVGIDSRVEDLLPLLAIGLNDVRIIGVWGMGELERQLLPELFIKCFLRNLKIVVLSLTLTLVKNLKNMVYLTHKMLMIKFL